MSVEQRDFEENLENLATLQRLELLLKFPAKTEENPFCVFKRPERAPKRHHLPTLRSFQESAQRRNESEQKLVKIKGAIRNCLGFSDGVFFSIEIRGNLMR
jgi:hypothetical protein